MFNEHIQNIMNRIFPEPNISRVFPAQIKFNYASHIININHIEIELVPNTEPIPPPSKIENNIQIKLTTRRNEI